MDCKIAHLLLDYARPRHFELSDEDHQALEQHLAACSHCQASANAERRFDEPMVRAMQAVPIPEGLQTRLLARLRTERDVGHSRWAARGVRVVAATAALVLIVWFGMRWWSATTPDLNVAALRDETFLRYESPDKEKVEAWFWENRRVATVAPRQFNYTFLMDYDLADCQNERVPLLLFVRGGHTARVYIVSQRQFNLQMLPSSNELDSAGLKVAVWRESADSDIAYIIIYTGDSLAPLLLDDQQSPA